MDAKQAVLDFPPELWALIVAYLPGEQLGRLKMTGSNFIWRQLRAERAVESINLGTDYLTFQRWPSFLNELRGLVELDISSDYGAWWQKWRPKLAYMPSGLRKLRIQCPLEFMDSFFSESPLISVQLPLLESLDVPVSWNVLRPRTGELPCLTSLTVSKWRTSDRLFDSLLQLKITQKLHCDPMSYIPPKLETLFAKEIRGFDCAIPFLPDTLTSIHSAIFCITEPVSIAQVPSQLPKSLTVLNGVYASITPTSYTAAVLPLLTELSISHLRSEFWSILPTTLKILKLNQVSAIDDTSVRQCFNPVDGKPYTFRTCPLEKLPKSITHLELTATSNHMIFLEFDAPSLPSDRIDHTYGTFPRELRLLKVGPFAQLSPNAAKQLPPSLTHLDITNLDQTVCEYLPRGLKTLFAHAAEVSPQLIKFLPRSLTSLQLQGVSQYAAWIDPITGLLTNWKEISAKKASGSKHEDQFWCDDYCLPSSLLDLELAMYGEVKNSFMNQSLPNLQRLRLAGDEFTNSVVPLLPRNLSYLSLSSYDMTGDCFADLPDNLAWLELDFVWDIQNCHIQRLPRNLQILSLRACTQLDPSCVKDLPRNLKELRMEECPILNSSSFMQFPYRIRYPNAKKVVFSEWSIVDGTAKKNTGTKITPTPKGLAKVLALFK